MSGRSSLRLEESPRIKGIYGSVYGANKPAKGDLKSGCFFLNILFQVFKVSSFRRNPVLF